MYQRIREAIGLSRDEMAGELGVALDQLEKWESGTAYPGVDIQRLYQKLDSRLRVFEKLRSAVETLQLDADLDRQRKSIRQVLTDHQPGGIDLEVDDVMIEHLSYAIDDFIRENNLGTDFPRSQLARHIYEHIKFLF